MRSKTVLRAVLTALIAVAVAASCVFCVTALSETEGDWEYKDASGSFTSAGVEITKYNGSESSLTVPVTLGGKKVVALGNKVFYENTALTRIVLPEYLEKIGDYCFFGASSLKNIEMGSRYLYRTGYECFYDCRSLESFTVPKVDSGSVTEFVFGYRAFYNCRSLKELTVNAPTSSCYQGSDTFYDAGADVGGMSVVFGDDVKDIPGYLFYNDEPNYPRVRTLVLGKNVESIGFKTFCDCRDLESVRMDSEKLSVIGDYAFSGCRKLGSFTIPRVTGGALTQTRIGLHAFYDCRALAELKIEAASLICDKKGPDTFYDAGCDAGGLTVVFGDAAENVPEYMFYCDPDHYPRVKKVTLGSSVEKIGYRAFCNCPELETVEVVSDKLADIGDYAFENCVKLSSFYIPRVAGGASAQTRIGIRAFYDCRSLASLTIDAEQIDAYNDGDIFYNAGADVGGMDAVFGDGCVNIPRKFFYSDDDHYVRLKTVVVGKNVESIGDKAFYNCFDLTTVDMRSERLTFVGDSAFAQCKKLTSFTVPKVAGGALTATKLGYQVFYNCFSLGEITINAAGLDCYDGAETFYDAGADTEGVTVIFGDDVTTIPGYLFYCSPEHYARVKTVRLGKNVSAVEARAFYTCRDLSDVWYPLSENDAASISIGDYNGELQSAVWHYGIQSPAVSYGDVDGDSDVTAADARLALRIAVKLEEAGADAIRAADVDGEDGVTAADARLILRFAVKLETAFPAQKA